jgi:hypothetical protein
MDKRLNIALRRNIKLSTSIVLLLTLSGCASEQERFDQDMRQHYEVQCDKYYSVYATGDIQNAKQAMQNMISYSIAERDKAKFY